MTGVHAGNMHSFRAIQKEQSHLFTVEKTYGRDENFYKRGNVVHIGQYGSMRDAEVQAKHYTEREVEKVQQHAQGIPGRFAEPVAAAAAGKVHDMHSFRPVQMENSHLFTVEKNFGRDEGFYKKGDVLQMGQFGSMQSAEKQAKIYSDKELARVPNMVPGKSLGR